MWAASNEIDSQLIRRDHYDAWVLLVVTGLLGAITGFSSLLSGRVLFPDASTLILGIATGVVGLLAFYPYYRALETANPTSAVLMWNTAPVLVGILAFVLLGERLGPISYVASGSLVASATVAAVASLRQRGSSPRAAVWMACASTLVAVEAIAQKALYMRVALPTGLLLTSAGSFATAATILLVRRATRRALVRLVRERGLGLVLVNEGLNLGGTFLTSWAVSEGPISAVKAIGGIQPLLVLGIARLWRGAAASRADDRPPVRFAASLLATALAVLGLALLGAAT